MTGRAPDFVSELHSVNCPFLRPAASTHGSLDAHTVKPGYGRLMQLARKESQKQVQQEAPFMS